MIAFEKKIPSNTNFCYCSECHICEETSRGIIIIVVIIIIIMIIIIIIMIIIIIVIIIIITIVIIVVIIIIVIIIIIIKLLLSLSLSLSLLLSFNKWYSIPMRHKLCRSFHPWCPGVKTRCLLTCAPRRSIVLQFFWHVDTRPISPFLFFFDSTFYLCIIIVIFYLMYLIH